jgi:hypothetical protein
MCDFYPFSKTAMHINLVNRYIITNVTINPKVAWAKGENEKGTKTERNAKTVKVFNHYQRINRINL